MRDAVIKLFELLVIDMKGSVFISDSDSSSSASDSDSDSNERSGWRRRSRTASPNYPSSPSYPSPVTIPDSDDVPFDFTDCDPSHTHDPLQHDLVDSLTSEIDGLEGLGGDMVPHY